MFSVDPRRLRPNPWNTNIVSPENEAKIANSLKELGTFKPLIVREKPDATTDYEILGGEHRWTIAINNGEATVDVYSVGVIDDDKAKKISLIDNARYGADDTLALGKMLEEIEGGAEIHTLLPWTETDVSAIFAASDIDLSELDFDEETSPASEPPEKTEKAAKTHTIMRFKVPIGDSERITDLITKTQKREGIGGSDELTNAGDALVHLLLSSKEHD